MTVISISITESAVQIISGIPRSISVNTNIAATVFYTLDGSDPNIDSLILINPLLLPTSSSTVHLKLFATDGVNTSAIVAKDYLGDIVEARLPHDKVSGLSPQLPNQQDPFPFGSLNENVPVSFGGTGGITVDSPDIVGIPDGYGADGQVVAETDQPLSEYKFIYSTTNKTGLQGKNVGTLPAKVKITVPPADPNSTNLNSKLFNPRALVIYQDNTQPNLNDDVLQLNRGYFTLDNPEKSMDGGLLDTTTFSQGGNIPYGSFLRQHFNSTDNTITYYYRDSLSNRWIISKEPYIQKNSAVVNLAQITFSSRLGRKVFQWLPLMRSTSQLV